MPDPISDNKQVTFVEVITPFKLYPTDLFLHGHATDHIWLMEDKEGFIGIRMDSGDRGVVYVTKSQAKSLAEQLQDFIKD